MEKNEGIQFLPSSVYVFSVLKYKTNSFGNLELVSIDPSTFLTN